MFQDLIKFFQLLHQQGEVQVMQVLEMVIQEVLEEVQGKLGQLHLQEEQVILLQQVRLKVIQEEVVLTDLLQELI